MSRDIGFFRRRFQIDKAKFPKGYGPEDILEGLRRRIRRANDIFFADGEDNKDRPPLSKLIPLRIEYGNGKRIKATGFLKPAIANELVEKGLLVKSKGSLKLNIPDLPECGIPTREQVNTHLSKIANWALDRGYISGLREPLYLADKVDESRKDEYACYDRNLDMLGFVVHSEAIILEILDGEYKGHLVVARRHDDFVHHKNDSIFDIASGAVTSRYTRSETHASELLDEFDIKGAVLGGIKPVDAGHLDTVTTARYRGENGIIREKMRVSVLGITMDEFNKLLCNDRKLVADTRHVTNVGYYIVAPDEMVRLLSVTLKDKKDRNVTYLKNAKALAMMLYLQKKGHIRRIFPAFSRELMAGLTMRPLSRFSIRQGRWINPKRRPKYPFRNPHYSIFSVR